MENSYTNGVEKVDNSYTKDVEKVYNRYTNGVEKVTTGTQKVKKRWKTVIQMV